MKLLGLNKCMTHEQKNNLGLSVTIDNMETGTVQNNRTNSPITKENEISM